MGESRGGGSRANVPDDSGSHDGALGAEHVAAQLRPRLGGIRLQRDVAPSLELQQLLEQLLHVVVRLRRRLHERALPLLRQRRALNNHTTSQSFIIALA